MSWIQRARNAWEAFREVVRAPVPPDYASYAFTTGGLPNAERIDQSFAQFVAMAYAGNSVVFGVANARLRLFTEARFKWRRRSDKKLFGDQTLTKLEKPWPGGTTGELLARMEQDASLAGNAYIRDCGDRLERLRPDWVTIVSEVTIDALGNEVREVIGYWYDPVGDTEREAAFYPVDEVAHWSPLPDPLANFRGMSWLTPVIREINADIAMTAHRDNYFRNAATPNLILKYAQKLDDPQIKRVRDQVTARHAGPENAGRTLVLDLGADPVVVGQQLTDVFSAVQAAGENRIAVAAGVPSIVAGLKEGLAAATLANYDSAVQALANLTVRPNWRSACAALSKLVTSPGDGVELWFDTSDIAALQDGEKDQADTFAVDASTASSLIQSGYTPDSVATAIAARDMGLLIHTGLFSVQLQPPGTTARYTPDSAAPGTTAPVPQPPTQQANGRVPAAAAAPS